MHKPVLAAIFLGLLVMVGHSAHAVDSEYVPDPHPEYYPEYHPRFGAIPLDDDVRAAIEKFPDVASCLKLDAVKNGEPDLDAIDWHKIRNDGDAKVCLFMIFEQLGGPEAVKAWLQHMKFKAFGPSEVSWLTPGQARHFGYEEQSLIGVTSLWSLEGQYPIYPTSGVFRYIRRVLSTGQTIWAAWFPDGRLMQVSIVYRSIFN